MKARPMLFSGPLALAILDGRKTVTRRPIKSVLGHGPRESMQTAATFRPSTTRGYDWTFKARGCWQDLRHAELVARCPHGKVGDHIYGRETWRTFERPSDMVDGIVFAADGAFVPIADTKEAADRWVDAHDNGKHGNNWRPSLHMPRWASRITLEITDVRVQRVRDLTEDDARAEGFTLNDAIKAKVPSTRDVFALTWGDLYGPGSWERNEWVWTLTFRRVTP